MRRLWALGSLALLAGANVCSAQTVTIPSGTKLMGELDQRVSSDVKRFAVGDMVQGHVWRNVVVEGQTVIKAGAPLVLRVADITKRKIAGRGGDVEIQAVSVQAVDGTEIFLDGGYDKQGGHRTGLSASLSALVFWPAIFIRGKEAVLDPGTIFDASVPAETKVAIAAGADRPRTIRIAAPTKLTVEVLYDLVDDKTKDLPMRVVQCGAPWSTAVSITAVNDAAVTALPLTLATPAAADDTCNAAQGTVALKDLSEHFRRGINRFTVTSGGQSAEVVLDIEM